ncbi:hypothetical protein L195_g038128 [Trifolium pratense]|uniref:Uncharacterized protein n=2 Tax=Trifolium pratense TaxID=57577 RepID=A0A2K3LU89_TRIPR|nr:hypothetical protein L195_g038128 [Trifolium pratense]
MKCCNFQIQNSKTLAFTLIVVVLATGAKVSSYKKHGHPNVRHNSDANSINAAVGDGSNSNGVTDVASTGPSANHVHTTSSLESGHEVQEDDWFG